jgi:hypothetical protein
MNINRTEGYYRADFAGCSDPSTVLYFDGKELWAHGSEKPIEKEALLFIDNEPFEHRSVNPDGSVSSPEEWYNGK